MGSASLITRVYCEAVRSAILATAWLLVSVAPRLLKFESVGHGIGLRD